MKNPSLVILTQTQNEVNDIDISGLSYREMLKVIEYAHLDVQQMSVDDFAVFADEYRPAYILERELKKLDKCIKDIQENGLPPRTKRRYVQRTKGRSAESVVKEMVA